MKKTNEMLRHIPELDGVRGIAILMVMVMHFMIRWRANLRSAHSPA